jgi:hypothetical protein
MEVPNGTKIIIFVLICSYIWMNVEHQVLTYSLLFSVTKFRQKVNLKIEIFKY